MNIFVACGPGQRFDDHFPPPVIQRLEALGNVHFQKEAKLSSSQALASALKDADVLISHWGTPRVTAEVLDACPTLSLLAHATGSVAGVASDAVYERGVPVISANAIMSGYVAEGILGYMLCGLRRIVPYNTAMKQKERWPLFADTSLFGARISFAGLGMVGCRLLDMLVPFAPEVRVYDPYLDENALAQWPFARRCDALDDALAGADILSIHASKTPETYHMIDGEALRLLSDQALVINAARGALIDTPALLAELTAGRLYAVLDVFEQEPLPPDHPLRGCENAVLIPHRAGMTAKHHMTEEIIDDIERFQLGKPLTLAIPYAKYRLMTQE